MLQSSQGFFFFLIRCLLNLSSLGCESRMYFSSAFREFQQLEIPVRSSRTRVWFLHGEMLENTLRFLGVFSNFSSAQENLRFSLGLPLRLLSTMFLHGTTKEMLEMFPQPWAGRIFRKKKEKKSRKKTRLKNHNDVYEGPAFHKLRGKKNQLHPKLKNYSPSFVGWSNEGGERFGCRCTNPKVIYVPCSQGNTSAKDVNQSRAKREKSCKSYTTRLLNGSYRCF